ncbi:hypothetical protein LEBR102806_00315 [Levilactobacillus brevis]|uniref:ParB/Sulfiredoxin domain-containing protein n=1 Tax=Levilactobacillus brevis ATCC 14869 = DSM 20054 TaxID=649758 RepID=U2PPT1_LEVBR|nr:hypothetical protein [Levilactobacillus brevis]ERK46136.1 hypothetical protein HMPREF0495_00062 [Levilactobacillus brevis ATCC 14869 = DSM 20054]KIO99087.1 hypothetical protein QP38_1776 [Levilactobacillus brevis]KRK20732.1 hypothetical protein FC61_GL001521 [Levilactobacillus brevis ATCC 14869 = DSM 20054]MCT3570982.1 hypothetical protein [Levilactobacillus brevis]MCT3571892.1 hypothetical protein [Levilactobacillus brevis]
MDTFNIESIDLKRLKLDKQNPRFSAYNFKNETEIINYLFRYEKLSSLIDEMLDKGFLELGERIIVLQDKSGYTVLEGNRRVAALKAITSTNKNLTQGQRKRIGKSSLALTTPLIIKCDVVSNRENANNKIASKHISGIEKWSPSSKMAFYNNTFNNLIGNGRRKLSSEEAIEEIKQTTPESATKIRNTIAEFKFLESVYDETKRKYPDLAAMPELSTEVISGRVLSYLKKDLSLVRDEYLRMNVPDKLWTTYQEILLIIGEFSWCIKDDKGTSVIDTRVVGTRSKWNEFLSTNIALPLRNKISEFQKPRELDEDSDRDDLQEKDTETSANDSGTSEEERTDKSKDDKSSNHQDKNSDQDIKDYKLIIPQDIVKLSKKQLPFDLVLDKDIQLFDAESNIISSSSSEYDKIKVKSFNPRAPILFSEHKVLPQSSEGTFQVVAQYNNWEGNFFVEIKDNKKSKVETSDIIYDDDWFLNKNLLLGESANFEKLRLILNSIDVRKDVSNEENLLICSALCRPLLEVTVRSTLSKIGRKSSGDTLIARISTLKNELCERRLLTREESKNISKIDDDLNALNGFLHSGDGRITTHSLIGIYSKYKLFLEKSFDLLLE